jgi:threonine aldolase
VQPWYDRPLAEIAALADSVYVSLYKGLGGMAGCVLAGSEPLIAAARPWRLRYGGDLPLAFPMIVTALDGLKSTLPRMADYHRHAVALAKAIDQAPGLTVFPSPPHCNSFQVHFAASAEAMEQAALASAQDTGTWLFGRFEQGLLPQTCFGEVTVGEASLALTPGEAAAALADLSRRGGEVQAA